MAKKVKQEIPAECCGVCSFSRNEDGQLICYAMPAYPMQDEIGEVFSYRGLVVGKDEPICHLFKPRMHS